jgi:fructose-specific phosphotransferase system IIA component
MTGFKEMLNETSAAVGLELKDKDAVLAAAVELLARNGKVPDGQKLLGAVKKREALASTGIGGGAALPHVLSDAVNEIMFAVLTLKNGVDFNAEDGKKVDIVFLIAGPKGETAAHLKLLSKIARLLHDAAFRELIRAASDAASLVSLIYEKE